MQSKDKTSWIGLLLYSILAFAAIWLEMLINSLKPFFIAAPAMEIGFNDQYLHLSSISFVWLFSAILLVTLARKINRFDLFSAQEKPGAKGIFLSVSIAAIAIFLSLYLSGWKIQPFHNLVFTRELNQDSLILTRVFEWGYYIFQSLLFLLVVIFSQEAVERKLNTRFIPWGGIFLMLIWGLLYPYINNSEIDIHKLIMSVVIGAVYMFVKKDIRFFFPLFIAIVILC